MSVDRVLEQIRTGLQHHGSVHAMWLAGSHGRGTADAFSDLDLWVAIDNEYIPVVNADPLGFVNTIVPTLMHVNAPSIAPPDGSFLGSWVPVGDAFVQVDWYFTPAESAERDADTRMVFGEIPVRNMPPSPPLSEEYIAEKVHDNLVMALQRINLMVKRARRGDTWGLANAARNSDTNLVTAYVLIQHGVNPQFEHLEASFLESPLPSTTVEVQELAYHLLDTVTQIASKAGVLQSHEPAIEAMRHTLTSWQDSGWVPTEEYYRTLPKRYMGAGVLITDAHNNVLLLETSYKELFEIPGGICDAGESPFAAAQREVREELGIDLIPGRMLVFDHRNQPAPKGDAISIVYDGGVITDFEQLRPDHREIVRFHFVAVDEIDEVVPDHMATRLRAALRARKENRLIEIADGEIVN